MYGCNTTFTKKSNMCKHHGVCKLNAAATPRDFGHEDTSHIPSAFFLQCLRNKSLVCLFGKINFDPAHPENHSVRIKSARGKTFEIVEDKEDIVVDKDLVLNCMVNRGWNILSSCYQENKELIMSELDTDELRSITKWLSCLYFHDATDTDEYENTTMKPTKDEIVKCIKGVKDDLFTMMVGKKTVPV